jgi:hypothetical protein
MGITQPLEVLRALGRGATLVLPPLPPAPPFAESRQLPSTCSRFHFFEQGRESWLCAHVTDCWVLFHRSGRRSTRGINGIEFPCKNEGLDPWGVWIWSPIGVVWGSGA